VHLEYKTRTCTKKVVSIVVRVNRIKGIGSTIGPDSPSATICVVIVGNARSARCSTRSELRFTYAVRLSRSDPRNSMSVTAHFLRPFGLVLRFYEAWAFRTTKIFKYILNTGECIYALFFDYLVRESTSVSSKNMNVNLMNNFH